MLEPIGQVKIIDIPPPENLPCLNERVVLIYPEDVQ